MKTLLLLSLFISSVAFAGKVPLNAFDQLKLGELVGKLPESVRAIEEENLDSGARIVKSVFPKEDAAFKFTCASTFHNGSPIASFSTCTLELDTHHEDLDVKYDEYKVVVKDEAVAKAFFGAIPYGTPSREFHSTERHRGTNFEGKNGNIFHYYFNCSVDSCVLKFSHKVFEEE